MTVALRVTAALLGALAVGACREERVEPTPVRPVRTVAVEQAADVNPVALTGTIEAKDQVDLSFRIAGNLSERIVSVGDRVAAGKTVARLQADQVQNNLRAARATLSAARANLTQAAADLERQQSLISRGVSAAARLEAAEQAERSAKASVEEAEAQLQSAIDNVSYTELKADAPGSVTATSANSGEFVSAGQTIVQIALDSGKDAVFNVPLKLIRAAPRDPEVIVMLAEDPEITAIGRVREVAPQANPITGTYEVRVGLEDPPEAMRLGATVIGRISLGSDPVVRLPGSSLTKVDGQPAVWVVEPEALTVAARQVDVLRYEADTVVIGNGLADDDIVVTAGVHALRPGQQVRLLGESK